MARYRRPQLSGLVLVLLFGLFSFAQEGDPPNQDDEKREPAKRGAKSDKKDKPEIPEIPPDRLPKATRSPPDPAKHQFIRDAVWIDLDEKIWPKSGAVEVPENSVTAEYLREYFRRSGFAIADAPEKAKYRVDGKVETVFEKELIFRKRILGWKYLTTADVRVRDVAGQVVEKVVIEEFARDGGKDEPTTALDCRRYLAKLLHDRLFLQGKAFTNKKVVDAFASLLTDPLDAAEPLRGEEIVGRLADIGLPAVPYALEAMTDKRTVLADTTYPGLEKLSDLKVYHLADKVLEEIFQKVSRMGLATPDRHRHIIIRGWENEWRRFCPPFRESPTYKRQLERAKARKDRGAASTTPSRNGGKSAPNGR